MKKIYYYKYFKRTGRLEFIETTLRDTPNRSSIDVKEYYFTYSYYNKAEALVDIMEYINKRNGE